LPHQFQLVVSRFIGWSLLCGFWNRLKSRSVADSIAGTWVLGWLRSGVLLLAIFSFQVLILSNVSAQPPCVVQSVNYDFPSSAIVGQQITVKTHLTATCVQWAPYWTEYSIRVDLTNTSNGFVLSTITYQVGYAQTYIDQVFLNTGTAPDSQGTWPLRVDVYIWGGGGQLLVHLANYAKLPVA